MSSESDQSLERDLVKGSGLEISIEHCFTGKTRGAECFFFKLGRESPGRKEGREGRPHC